MLISLVPFSLVEAYTLFIANGSQAIGKEANVKSEF